MADHLPHAHVMHHLPHRLRVHVSSRKRDRTYFDRVAARLKAHPKVRSVRVSHHTGSIAIEYDGQASDIARLAREDGLFDLPEAELAHMLFTSGAVRITGVDPNAAVSASLAGLGVYQLIRGEVLGSAVEHISQAYGAARMLGNVKLAAFMALLGVIQIGRGETLSPAASLFLYAVMVRAMNTRRPTA